MARHEKSDSEHAGGARPKLAPAASSLDTWHEPASAEVLARPRVVPALTILYHAQIDRVGGRALLHELAAGQPAFLSRTTPDFTAPSRAAEPLADRSLSRNPIRLTAKDGSIRISPGECRTRVTVAGEPLRDAIDLAASDVERGVVLEIAGRIVLLLHHAAEGAVSGAFATQADDAASSALLGESRTIQRLRHDIRRVADLDVPVLIRGASGTGKELAARAIHLSSARREGPFVAVNLAAVPASLASSELFGAERGAFTGASQRRDGYFKQAEGGTLFLDEVGEAPAEIQVALLRSLETGEIQAVGADRPHRVDVRVLAATDADLEAKLADNSFRAPLLHRLAAYELWVPPLCERRDDIGRLLIRFLQEELTRIGEAHRLMTPPERGELWLPASVVARLAQYDWPGNVRQLRNVVRRLVIGNRGRSRIEISPEIARLMQPAPKPASIIPRGIAGDEPIAPPSADRRRPSDVSDDEIDAALRASRWDLAAAADLLRISRPSLYTRIEGNPRFHTSSDLSPEEIARAYEACGGDIEQMVDRLEVSERALRQRLRSLGLEERVKRSKRG